MSIHISQAAANGQASSYRKRHSFFRALAFIGICLLVSAINLANGHPLPNDPKTFDLPPLIDPSSSKMDAKLVALIVVFCASGAFGVFLFSWFMPWQARKEAARQRASELYHMVQQNRRAVEIHRRRVRLGVLRRPPLIGRRPETEPEIEEDDLGSPTLTELGVGELSDTSSEHTKPPSYKTSRRDAPPPYLNSDQDSSLSYSDSDEEIDIGVPSARARRGPEDFSTDVYP
ncbi:hypothetical protein TWF696_007354 [Orbilia brochopaga]|uniref:Uncharacterized protein n=1 Tax=Orbilia brochopaga TaxID=3140254 RepID=A0AAV9UVA3_9PEZI